MKKLFKVLGFALLAIVLFLLTFYLVKNEKLPEGTPSQEADQLALKMVESLNKAAWDSTKTISWTFRGDHNYRWDRVENMVTIRWDDIEVHLDPETITGQVVENDYIILGDEKEKLTRQAWDGFNNDSFWLAAPYKVFDPGTERSIVKTRDGRTGLMVTYTSGGTTPGDSYVWILDEDHRPTSVKMWVSILPIGGMEFTWENYQILSSDAMVATEHWFLNLVKISIRIE